MVTFRIQRKGETDSVMKLIQMDIDVIFLLAAGKALVIGVQTGTMRNKKRVKLDLPSYQFPRYGIR